MRDFVNRMRATMVDVVSSPRIPIWLQLSLATMLVLALSIGILSYVIMARQKDNLRDHIIKLGTVSLNHVGSNAKVPLLTDDPLALNTLINNVSSVDGHYYAFIVNNDGIIKAHTDRTKIDTPFIPFIATEKIARQGDVTYFNYTLPNGVPILNLSTPIVFQNKKLGEVNVGLSVDFIQNLFIDEQAFLIYATLNIIFLGMLVAVFISRRFSKPLTTLVEATTQIAQGNYDFKVTLKRNDELGTLAEAFNRMGTELFRQSMMKESFGKYVGPEVLNMILESPEHAWLKGRKNKASILFADIRGFTGYVETTEPEEVVKGLNDFFTIASRVVMEQGGYIDKFIGDSVLAVFGIPAHQQNHQKRCVQAAIFMQQELSRAARNGNPLLHSIGIGIASGVVVAGNIGSPLRMEYTVIGDCVNVASYLCSFAESSEIIIDGYTEEKLEDGVEVTPLVSQQIKGRKGLVRVYRVLGFKETHPIIQDN
jgi:adenylate cyclase